MNEQEEYWAGVGGDGYCRRHHGDIGGTAEDFQHRVRFWRSAVDWDELGAPSSVIEFGANIGMNLSAIAEIHHDLGIEPPMLWAVEINPLAADRLEEKKIPVFRTSMLSEGADGLVRCDLAFTMGVLIHIAPEDLNRAYDVINASSLEWVLMAEYFCPMPREIIYRGEKNKLWARDFAGEFMDRFPVYRLHSYGFAYKRDKMVPLDNLNWFLLRKDRVVPA